MKICKIVLIGILIFSPVSSLGSEDDIAVADLMLTIKPSSSYGCTDMNLKVKIDDYAINDDRDNAKVELNAAVNSGICRLFFNGQKVLIADDSYLELGLVKIIPAEDFEKARRNEPVKYYWYLNSQLYPDCDNGTGRFFCKDR